MNEFPKQGSVYWFNPDPTKGSEMRKTRPCLVVSPNEMNEHLRTIIVVPLTTMIQPWPFRLTITILGRKSSLACDQIRTVDRSRLKAHIAHLKPVYRKKVFALLQTILSE